MANSEKALEGWSVTWNTDGALEQSAKYSDLTTLKCKMPDRGHVGMSGYIRWMDAMKPTLQSLLPDRPQETKPAQQNPV